MDEDQPFRKLYRRVVRTQALELYHLDWNSSSSAWENSWALTKGSPPCVEKAFLLCLHCLCDLFSGADSSATWVKSGPGAMTFQVISG